MQYKKIDSIKREYNHFLYFIHEFHHIIGSQILSDNYKNLYYTYMLVPDTFYPKVFSLQPQVCNISFQSHNYFTDKKKEKINLIILKIKSKLSGYASEEAFKAQLFLLKYFTKNTGVLHTKSFFTLLLDQVILEKKISDIEQVLEHQNDIDYTNSLIINYIHKYKKT